MTVRLTNRRRNVPALLAAGVVAVGALSGCAGQPGAAAVVGNETITVSELQDATSDLAPYLQNVSQSSVLTVLVVAPTFERAAVAAGVGVSTTEAAQLLDRTAAAAAEAGTVPARTTPFSDSAVEVVKFTMIQTNLSSLPDATEVTAQVAGELAELDADVNPRYGEADFTTGSIVPVARPWLVETAPAE